MSLDLDHLSTTVIEFLTRRHLATLTTLNRDGSPHVVPVGFTYDAATRTARVITSGESVKARNASRAGARAAICQVDGGRWLTVSGRIRVLSEPEPVADAVERYAARYRTPKVNATRVVLLMDVSSMMGRVSDPVEPEQVNERE